MADPGQADGLEAAEERRKATAEEEATPTSAPGADRMQVDEEEPVEIHTSTAPIPRPASEIAAAPPVAAIQRMLPVTANIPANAGVAKPKAKAKAAAIPKFCAHCQTWGHVRDVCRIRKATELNQLRRAQNQMRGVHVHQPTGASAPRMAHPAP